MNSAQSTASPTVGEATEAPSPGSCVVCGGEEAAVVFHEFGVDILRCRRCGHVFSGHRTPQDYDGYFGEEMPGGDQFWWDAAHRRMYEAFARRFLRGRTGRLLDMGCGLGYFVRFASRVAGWDVQGYEISPAAVRYAREVLGLENVACGRVESSGLPAGHFDVITLWDVIEHVSDPGPLLSYLATILGENGVLFLHTPNVQVQLPKARVKRLLLGMRPDRHYLEARDHMNIYSPSTIRRVLACHGFSDVAFIHLPPVQSICGSKSRLLRALKNTWFQSARALHALTLRSINLDNLFVVARKRETDGRA